MGKIFMRLAIVAWALLMFGSLASAGNGIHCSGFATAAVKISQKIRELVQSTPGGQCTGHNLLDPFWSTNSIRQREWCLSVLDETADTRMAEMQEAVAKCGYCGAYANSMTAAATDNIKFGCGFKNDRDQRWKPDAKYHFNGCMAAKDCEDVCAFVVCKMACVVEVATIRKLLDPNVAQVTLAVAQCKAEKNIGKTSSPLTPGKDNAGFQDTIRQLKDPDNIGTSSGIGRSDSVTRRATSPLGGVTSGNDLINPSGTTNRRATPPKGSTTSGNDLANPSGGSARRATDPCRSAVAGQPCKPAARMLVPGLLESDSGFSPLKPATATAPVGPPIVNMRR